MDQLLYRHSQNFKFLFLKCMCDFQVVSCALQKNLTSSVFWISRFCKACIFWIISYVLGSLPWKFLITIMINRFPNCWPSNVNHDLPIYKFLPTSSFLHRWIFMGFSNSSSKALQRVLSRNSSRCVWYTSRLKKIRHVLRIITFTKKSQRPSVQPHLVSYLPPPPPPSINSKVSFVMLRTWDLQCWLHS
jgi:hypothetical protein